MAVWLKRGKDIEKRAEANRQVRATVETILGDVEKGGDAAVLALSKKFDGWEPKDFRLSPNEIDACMGQLSDQDLTDIAFAQTQVRNFAEANIRMRRYGGRNIAYATAAAPPAVEAAQ